MSAKRYPEEFKIEAVKQVVDRGHSVSDVAKRLDVTTHSLYAWVKKYGPDSKQHNELSDAQAEIRRLQKELKRTVNLPSSAQFKIRNYAANLRLNSLGGKLPSDSCGLSSL